MNNFGFPEVISHAKTIFNYVVPSEDLMPFRPNLNVKVFSKAAGSNLDIWGVEIDGKRGYVPYKYLRETKKVFRGELMLVDVDTKSKKVPSIPKEEKAYDVIDGTTIYLQEPQEPIVPSGTLEKIETTVAPDSSIKQPDVKQEKLSDDPVNSQLFKNVDDNIEKVNEEPAKEDTKSEEILNINENNNDVKEAETDDTKPVKETIDETVEDLPRTTESNKEKAEDSKVNAEDDKKDSFVTNVFNKISDFMSDGETSNENGELSEEEEEEEYDEMEDEEEDDEDVDEDDDNEIEKNILDASTENLDAVDIASNLTNETLEKEAEKKVESEAEAVKEEEAVHKLNDTQMPPEKQLDSGRFNKFYIHQACILFVLCSFFFVGKFC